MALPARDQAARLLRPIEETDGSAAAEPARPQQPSAPRETGKAPAEAPVVEAPVKGKKQKKAAPAKSGLRRKVFMGIGALAALAAVYFGIHYLLVGRFWVTTDDAYVRANNTVLGAKVAGYISKIAAGDNSEVKAGDLLFQIDDGDYVIAVNNAKARIGTQEATIERIGKQALAQQSAVDQAKSQVASAQAAVERTQADFARQEELSAKGFASKATYDVSKAGRDQAVASLQGAQAQLDAAQAQVDVINAQQAEAKGQLAELKTSLAKAERDLAFTTVRAPVDGVFSNRMVNAGDYIQVGQRLANVVPLNDVYIDANFKETQLGRIRPGQHVSISVDAVSGRTFDGVVESLAPASGSVFTLLPPDNATGNFTKIVQRLPVRVHVSEADAKEHLMRAGMSVIVSVNTKAEPQSAQNAAAQETSSKSAAN
ncbi:MAG: HlyD family secretion protein [Bradyrhizobiaceae bacterium]|nr:MAG: HlyD family secretion protein [Bradyrhizobiaceae bacterium]